MVAGSGRSADVIWAAFMEHVSPKRGGGMDRESRSFVEVLRQPSAFVPLMMSLVALAMVLGDVAMFGAIRDKDEGAVAHLWQLLMAGQAPIVALLRAKWLPRAPRQTLDGLSHKSGRPGAVLLPSGLMRPEANRLMRKGSFARLRLRFARRGWGRRRGLGWLVGGVGLRGCDGG